MANFIAYLEGLFLGLSLIIAIGAQNLFVFQQGLIGRYVFLVCMFCSVSDALLIYIGYSGMFFILNKSENLQIFLFILGSLWVSVYGIIKIREGFNIKDSQSFEMLNNQLSDRTLVRTLITLAGITWLNPHVYLDTVFLIGSIANTIDANNQVVFIFGAMSASFIFFFFLGYIGNKIRPLIKTHTLWRRTNIFLGLIMLAIGIHLGVSGLRDY